MRRRLFGFEAIVLTWLLCIAAVGRAQECDPDVLCPLPPGQPCIISGSHHVAFECDLDFGARDVTLESTARLIGDFGSYSFQDYADFSIHAHSFAVLGSIIGGGGGLLALTVDGDFSTESVSRVNINGILGKLDIVAGGNVTVAGPLSADGDSGTIYLTAGGSVEVKAEISADGVSRGSAGSIAVTAQGGPITITTTAPIHAQGSATQDGGSISFDASDDVIMNGEVHADGGSDGTGGGIDVNGGYHLTIGDVTIGNLLSAEGGGGEGSGGTIDIKAINVTVGGPLTVDGRHGQDGGAIAITGSGNATIDADLTARGAGDGTSGGEIALGAGSEHSITIDAGRTLVVTTTADGERNGDITLGFPSVPCAVVLAGTLDAQGGAGSGRNVVVYRGSFDATDGVMLADPLSPGGNVVVCRCVDPNDDGVCDGGCVHDPILNGATIDPAPQLTPVSLDQCGPPAIITPTPTVTMTPTPTPTATDTPIEPSATPTASMIPPCAAVPVGGCRTPVVSRKALLVLKKKSPGDDLLIWKWIKGAVTAKADFGSPLTTTDYQLCIYDGMPARILEAAIPAGGLCHAASPRECWREKQTGFTYENKDATPDGITRMALKEGLVDGKASIILKGKGALLDDLTHPITQPVTVQLLGSGVCWEARYGAPAITNTSGPSGHFMDRAD